MEPIVDGRVGGQEPVGLGLVTRTSTVTASTPANSTQRPEPALLSGTSQARPASATNASDGTIRGRTWVTKPYPSIIVGIPRRTNQRSVWRSTAGGAVSVTGRSPALGVIVLRMAVARPRRCGGRGG